MAFEISTDKNRLNPLIIRDFLAGTYWAKGILLENILKRIENSLCFGVYDGEKQVGFARVVTDFESFAYIADVFILEDYRGQGLSKELMKAILSYPDLKNMRRIMLATRDAHGLYAQFGFKELEKPDNFMEKTILKIYTPQS